MFALSNTTTLFSLCYGNKPFSDMNNNYNYQSPPKNWMGPDPVQNIISLLDDDAVICQIDFYTEQFQNLMLQYRKVSKMAFDDLRTVVNMNWKSIYLIILIFLNFLLSINKKSSPIRQSAIIWPHSHQLPPRTAPKVPKSTTQTQLC